MILIDVFETETSDITYSPDNTKIHTIHTILLQTTVSSDRTNNTDSTNGMNRTDNTI